MSKTVVITGASSGFGKLVVPLLLRRGHTVIAGLRGGRTRAETVFSESELSTGRLVAVDVHMERPETLVALRELVERDHDGRVDVLVNNAGYGLLGPAEDQDDETVRYQLEVNFFGPVRLTNELLPALREARGRILNVSSVMGLVSMPLYGFYSASKFALEAWTEALYTELKPFGVQVGLVEPGAFQTHFSERAAEATSAVTVHEGSLYAARSARWNAFLVGPGSKGAGDPMAVARLLDRLAVRRRVPIRSLIGIDAHALRFMDWLLPSGLRVWLVDLFFRKVVFRE